MFYRYLLDPARSAFMVTLVVLALLLSAFFAFEPSVGRSATSSFTVSQTITNEISFLVSAANVSMDGSIAGVTGGYATGTTIASVNTNNATGYRMTLHFATNSVAHAMVSSSTAATSSYISNYTPASVGVPDFTWTDNTSGQAAEFGYTVRASTSNEVDPSFTHNGTTCGSGGTETDNRCWLNPTTTSAAAETIINSTAANNSSTTTIKFKVAVPNSPSPSLPSGIYIATGTLTATTNP
jgi:hypothetical protein